MSTRVIVADSSVLIDVERVWVEATAFALGLDVCVPDLLYDRELVAYGDRLPALGLKVLELDGAGVLQAVRYRRLVPSLSLSHASALALAHRTGATLLIGEVCLRSLAIQEGVACRDILWLRERIHRVHDRSTHPSHGALASLPD